MLIPVTCPHCETTYQLQSELRGQSMRCPNSLCLEVFVVPAAEGRAAPATEADADSKTTPSQPESTTSQTSGSVGDLVELLPTDTESAPLQPTAESPAAASTVKDPPIEKPKDPAPQFQWREPPASHETEGDRPIVLPAGVWKEPPVRKSFEPAAPSNGANSADSPRELDKPTAPTPAEWHSPPVRADSTPLAGEDANDVLVEIPDEPDVSKTHLEIEEPPAVDGWLGPATGPELMTGAAVSRRTILILGGLLASIVAIVGAGILFFVGQQAGAEAQRRQAAQELYDKLQFADAARIFAELEREFFESEHLSEYVFLRQMALAREPIYAVQSDTDTLLRALVQFETLVKNHQQNPLLAKHQTNVWSTLHKAAVDVADLAKRESDPRLIERSRRLLLQLPDYQAPDGMNVPRKVEEVESILQHVEAKLVQRKQRQLLLDELGKLAANPSGNIVKMGHKLAAEFAKSQPSILSDAEVKKLLDEMPIVHRNSVSYVAIHQPAKHDWGQKVSTGMFLASTELQKPATSDDSRPIVALANGVLYSIDSHSGAVLWVRRIGLDAAPPVLLPSTPDFPDRLLVLLSAPPAIALVEARSGQLLWRQRLSSPCPGRPLQVGRRVFVACSDGRIHEIDVWTGLLLGVFEVGQQLTGWAVQQREPARLFVSAEKECIFVLDAAKNKCADILYTDHPTGSLLGPPIALAPSASPQSKLKNSYSNAELLLLQTKGPDRTQLRIIRGDSSLGPIGKAESPHSLPGWTWFAPWRAFDRMALATDAGTLALFGIDRDARGANRVFPRLHRSFLPPMNQSAPQPAAVVYGKHDRYWVLSHGRLHHLKVGFFRDVGPKLLPPWREPIALGMPLQGGQIRIGKNGDDTMYLVTRPGNGGNCLVSALAANRGDLLWQTRLGLRCSHQPIVVQDKVIVVTDSGGAYVIDTTKIAEKNNNWQSLDDLLSAKLAGIGQPIRLVARVGENSMSVVSERRSGKSAVLIVRQIEIGSKIKSKHLEIPLTDTLQGTAAIGKNCLIAPLADGTLARCSFSKKQALAGPSWRAENADANAVGHVVWRGESDFVFTDGSRGVHHVHWPEGALWGDKSQLQLRRRITRAPVLFQSGAKKNLQKLVVADSGDNVTLLQLNPLKILRSWSMPEGITAGPFIRGRFIGCIVNRRKLVWIDPNKKDHFWTFSNDTDLVGLPFAAANQIIVADVRGRISFLNPANGKVIGEPLQLPADSAPAVAPVSYQPGRLFVPLSDGTLFWRQAPVH